MLGITYTCIPPENTRYISADCFTDIEREMLIFFVNPVNVCLLGDFNARTGKLTAFVYLDIFFIYNNHIELDEETRQPLEDVNVLRESKGLLERMSSDIHRNDYGYKLIELCENNNLYIVNGRIGETKLTCKDSNTVDYIICSAFLFQ